MKPYEIQLVFKNNKLRIGIKRAFSVNFQFVGYIGNYYTADGNMADFWTSKETLRIIEFGVSFSMPMFGFTITS